MIFFALTWLGIQVTVNSGGVVFFALFNTINDDDLLPKEAAAVIKIAPSRMATQSERLGYEFARLLGVKTPQVGTFSFCHLHHLVYLVISHYFFSISLLKGEGDP